MSIDPIVFSVIIIAVIVILFSKMFKIVPQSNVYIVERLGKYNRTLESGLNFIIPILDKVRVELSIKEEILNIPKQQVITKDNVNISVDGIVYLAVFDPKLAVYNVGNYVKAISNLAMTTLRGEIGSLNLDDTLSSRDKLNASLQIALGDPAANWGVKITRIEISEISVPHEIEESMNLQMKAEREKRAIELNAQAEKEALIRKAEAFKQQQVLEAEAIERMADAKKYEQITIANAQKESMDMLNESLSKNHMAAEFLLAKDRIQAFNKLASSQSKDKVIVPYEVTELIGSLSLFKDFIKNQKD
ncbi:paraslipin [Campylobacter pinnipediorum subsp. pinnipediorum]|uniref:Paraslipin n=1 Tax=Campylobacter pinnipediorum subsp. pinnipediorum TaxID=1660067 RepID=A0AAX0LB48_9BACT|nr:SPFH domain-containing protein [Campylobacter pinnipediorum]OPA81706.1 paraslipin [Campylobacter pinnipediorum subsp. pinnipediorum]